MRRRLAAALIAAPVLALAALPAQAEVYKWVDDKGQVNYSNAPPPSVAGKAQPVDERISVMGMDPAVRAAAERRFAEQARTEEMDWQRRQQALSAQQAYSAQPTYVPYSDSGYGYSYPYYGGAYVAYRRPVLVRAAIRNAPRVSHHARVLHHARGGHAGRGSRGR